MKTVLIVDPDALARKELIRALPKIDLKTVEMQDGMEVLRYLSEHTADLVISELELPFLGGLEFTKAIKQKKEHARTSVIFVTSKSDPASMIQGIKAGAKQYFTKPIKPDELRDKFSKALGAR